MRVDRSAGQFHARNPAQGSDASRRFRRRESGCAAGRQRSGRRPRAYVYRLREQIAELRRQEEPEDFDDATRPADLKQANWPGLVALCEEALANETKDLRVAVHLLEGLANTQGFAGVAEGLDLLSRLLADAWERLNPPLADGDLDERAAPLANMLDDPDHGLRFPLTIRAIPLIGGLGYTQWLALRASSAANDQQTAAAAAQQPDAGSRSRARPPNRGLPSEPENAARDLRPTDGRGVAEPVHGGRGTRRLPPRVDSGATAAQPRFDAHGRRRLEGRGGWRPGRDARSRSDAYTQLDRAADVLLELEPHSPIPYLVKRAVKLGRLPFPQLMQRMIRDGNVLAELSRELDLDAAGTTAK